MRTSIVTVFLLGVFSLLFLNCSGMQFEGGSSLTKSSTPLNSSDSLDSLNRPDTTPPVETPPTPPNNPR